MLTDCWLTVIHSCRKKKAASRSRLYRSAPGSVCKDVLASSSCCNLASNSAIMWSTIDLSFHHVLDALVEVSETVTRAPLPCCENMTFCVTNRLQDRLCEWMRQTSLIVSLLCSLSINRATCATGQECRGQEYCHTREHCAPN